METSGNKVKWASVKIEIFLLHCGIDASTAVFSPRGTQLVPVKYHRGTNLMIIFLPSTLYHFLLPSKKYFSYFRKVWDAKDVPHTHTCTTSFPLIFISFLKKIIASSVRTRCYLYTNTHFPQIDTFFRMLR